MKRLNNIWLSVFSGILLGLAWIPGSTGLILLFAFVPLLLVDFYYYENRKVYKSYNIFWNAALAFFIWNIIATWWIKNASFVGLVMAVVVNTLLMALIFWLAHITRRRTGNGMGNFAFIIYWITFEWIYINGEISWPWLTLGYGFAEDIQWVQWYELTGSLGGSLWVLLSNVLIYVILKRYVKSAQMKSARLEVIMLAIWFFVPVVYSFVRFNTYKEKENSREIVVLQPNIDPYKKFVDMESIDQTKILVRLADSLTDENTDYVVGPETAINNNIWLNNIWTIPDIRLVRKFVDEHPHVKFIVGITSLKRYEGPETPTSRPIGNSGYYYDTFNSAIQIDSSSDIQVYHKSKLVVGIEKMPYPQILGFLKKLTVRLGGTFRSHGTQTERANFYSKTDSTGISPVICYESVYGEFVTDYIKKGSDFIFIVTNDGWWGNTPGHVQHNNYASLRAIETRRSIARSANTGISSFINQRGEILQELGWWKRGALKETLHANQEITFYVKHGDYIGRIAAFFAVLTLLYTITARLIRKKM
jgi:apolipoprotein N-acyltransferase